MPRAIRRTFVLAGLLTAGAQPALAHPGHAVELVPSSSASHYLLQPEHAMIWLAAVCAAGFLCRILTRRPKLAWQKVAEPFADSSRSDD